MNRFPYDESDSDESDSDSISEIPGCEYLLDWNGETIMVERFRDPSSPDGLKDMTVLDLRTRTASWLGGQPDRGEAAIPPCLFELWYESADDTALTGMGLRHVDTDETLDDITQAFIGRDERTVIEFRVVAKGPERYRIMLDSGRVDWNFCLKVAPRFMSV